MTKLQNKARRVMKNEEVKKFDAELKPIVQERDKALYEANDAFNKDVESAKKTQSMKRKEAWDIYKQKRDELLKKYA